MRSKALNFLDALSTHIVGIRGLEKNLRAFETFFRGKKEVHGNLFEQKVIFKVTRDLSRFINKLKIEMKQA